MQHLNRLFIKPGAHVARPAQFAVLLDTQHQRTETGRTLGRAFSFGESADDEFAGLFHLPLHPIGSASRLVHALRALAHNAFQPLLLDGFQHGGSVAREVLRVANVLADFENLFQQFFAFQKWHGTQIVAIQVQQIEGKKRNRVNA